MSRFDEDAAVFDMRDIPLGTLVHRAGLLTAEQLEAALAEGSDTGRRLGEILIARGLLEERQVAELIAGQKGLPFVELHPEAVDPAARGVLPEHAPTRYGALVIGIEDGIPTVAIADPADESVVGFIEESLGSAYRLVIAPRAQIERAAMAAAPPGSVWPALVASRVRLVLRLVNGEVLELGAYVDRDAAHAAAAEVVERAIAGEAAGWLVLDGRRVRPGAIVSLDLV